ncbi:MAG: hypothetical protein Q7S40_14575 [Opitutaceae bacterium]|nr:hypothetical protein [Opitutaceae bacterium]
MNARANTPSVARAALAWTAILTCSGAAELPELWDVGLDAETLAASDVRLDSVKADALWMHRGGETTLTADWSRQAVDYTPAPTDIITQPARRKEVRRSAQFDTRWAASPRHAWLGSAGLHRGFSDYRAVWIDEHDRQLFEGAPNFRSADPHGWNATAGARWTSVPGNRQATFSVTHERNAVAPGYEPRIGEPLVRGRERLRTWSGRLSLDQVVTPRLRLRLDTSVADTTGRDRRYGIVAFANWALAEHWVVRTSAGLTREDPLLSARFAQLTVERDWAGKWFAGVTAHGYRDDGEVVDPLVLSSAAPALRTLHFAASLRWQDGRNAWRVEAGPYRTDYATPATPGAQFTRLYRDRHWLRAQVAFSRTL